MLLLCSSAGSVASPALNQPDSVGNDACVDYKFRPTQVVIPAMLFTVGAIGINEDWRILERRYWESNVASDILRVVPNAGFVGLGLVGVKARHTFTERMLLEFTGSVVMGLFTRTLKACVSEERPNRMRLNSFPSGHTAYAFLGAELLRLEYGMAWGLGAYAFATVTGYLRMRSGHHFLNDVLAGAGIGIFAARAAMWLLPLEQKLLGWDSKSSFRVAVLPEYTPQTQSVGASFSMSF